MTRLTACFIIIMTLVVVFFTVTGNHGLLHLGQMHNEMHLLENKNRELESEIAELTNEIYALEKSRAVLEKHAREELGLSRENEIVYIFPEDRSDNR